MTMHTLTLSKRLALKLDEVAQRARRSPEAIAREAIAERVRYLDWEAKAIAAGQAESDAGQVESADEVRAALNRAKSKRAAIAGKRR